MSAAKALLVACDVITAYGSGMDGCWKALLRGETAIRPMDRFGTEVFCSRNAAVIPELTYLRGESLVMQMIRLLLDDGSRPFPEDAHLFLATTTGEIEILERYVQSGEGNARESLPSVLLHKVARLSGARGPATHVSSACVSSTAALGQAAALIREGACECALVVACDGVSEFVFSGFSSLMALDEEGARPFDRDRRGLSIGDAAAYALIMSEGRARAESRPVLGEILGWGFTCDANHMTGPSRDGRGLALAIRKAMQSARVSRGEVAAIAAHGTGTLYNDSMEMKAFKQIFDNPVPTYSIKGGTGHTMGSAGLVQALLGFKSLWEKAVPPTVNLREPDEEARGWVSTAPVPLDGDVLVSTNAGFGGVNGALVLRYS